MSVRIRVTRSIRRLALGSMLVCLIGSPIAAQEGRCSRRAGDRHQRFRAGAS